MSPEISTLLSEYAEYLDEIAPPITVEELQGMVSRPPLRSVPTVPRRKWRVAVAAAVVALVAGGLVLLAQRPARDQLPVVTQPDPASTTVPPTTPTTTPETPPTPDATPGGGLKWRKVESELSAAQLNPASSVWDGGDRIVVPVIEGQGGLIGEIRTSFDGATWSSRRLGSPIHVGDVRAIWEDTVLAVAGGGGFSTTEDGPIFTRPSTILVLTSDGNTFERVFEGDARAAAIGPKGIVVGASALLDEELIVQYELGSDFARSLASTEVRDDVLYAETADGQSAEIPLAERGYDPTALGRVDGWYSSDGEVWQPILDFPPIEAVIGTRDGFVGLAGREVWHSVDGRTWQRLGLLDFFPGWFSPAGPASRWRDGALVTDGSDFVYASAVGLEQLPPPSDPIRRSASGPWPLGATGDLGIVMVSVQSGQILFSPDGVSWETSALPEDMTDSFGWYTSSGAATDDSVLLVLWDDHGTGGPQEPVWWLGSLR